MEISWLRIKSGLLLQHYRKKMGCVLEIGEGGRLDDLGTVGNQKVVRNHDPDIYNCNLTSEMRLRGKLEAGPGYNSFAGTAGHEIDPTDLDVITLNPISAATAHWRIGDGTEGQLIALVNLSNSRIANVWDTHGTQIGYIDYSQVFGWILFIDGYWYEN